MALKRKRGKRNAFVKPHSGKMIGAFKNTLASLRSFAVPDHDYWAVLPKAHRIGIFVLASLLFVLVIWPNSEPEQEFSTEAEQGDLIPLHLQNSDIADSDSFLTAEYLEQKVDTEQNENSFLGGENDDNSWVSHKVKPGDTLAEIFRSQKLPLPDLYAITAIEGKDKPLSYIKPGQRLRFKRNADGEIEMIEVETIDKQAVLFARLPNGRFVRR